MTTLLRLPRPNLGASRVQPLAALQAEHLNEFLRPGHSGRIESNGTSHPELPWNALWRSDVREAIVETSGCVRPTTARPPERQRDIDHVRRITTKPPMRNNT